MAIRGDSSKLILLISILGQVLWLNSVSAVCEYSFSDNEKLYNYSLATPISNFPHGILSEDGFYKVEANGTVIWFQLCSGMIFNHDHPKCVDCSNCGGPSHCGMECSALASSNIGGYHVCTSIGHVSNIDIAIIDANNPHKGVVVTMSSTWNKVNCSLSVSVFCDSNGLQEPKSLKSLGACDYATELWHPSGCATIVPVYGGRWGWFGTFMIIIFCFFGGYLLAGTIYRHFFIGARGIDVIPNLEFWTRFPQRTQSLFMSLVWKIRGPSQGHRSSYSALNF